MKVSTELIPRTDRGDDPERGRPVEWSTAEQCFRRGGVFWLVSPDQGGAPHQRPCFAAWHGVGFFLVGNAGARKTRNLLADGRASLGCDAGDMHLVVEGTVHRVTDENTLRSASTAFADIYSWPTQVAGDQLDAPYGAPTSGGPPYQVYELTPARAFVFPSGSDMSVEPTRWTFSV